ncbi:MAG: methyltransferase [Pseudomonadota bacterium]
MSDVTDDDTRPRARGLRAHGRTTPGNPIATPTLAEVPPSAGAHATPQGDRSPYLVDRLLHGTDENLFNHVKFHLVKQRIAALGLARPRVLDIGCGLKVAQMYLTKLGLRFDYHGVDYETRFRPDAVVDLLQPETITPSLPWEPNVVLMLDVLEHIHADKDVLLDVVRRVAETVPDHCTFVFTLPQMYRLDRFKLSHLDYPEHKVRFEQREWREILSHSLAIEHTQGLGYLSVLPYLPMASRHYTPDNRLGRLFHYLRGTVFEWGPLKPADLFLSNTLGAVRALQTCSNDVLFVARKRTGVARLAGLR